MNIYLKLVYRSGVYASFLIVEQYVSGQDRIQVWKGQNADRAGSISEKVSEEKQKIVFSLLR